MFETTSTKFPKTRELSKGVPFLLRVNFQELLSRNITIDSEKVMCEKCGAFLTSANDIQKHDKIGYVFECVFCGTLNHLKIKPSKKSNALEIPLMDSLVQELEEKETSDITDIQPTGRPWIACIDTSGSMQGNPILAVKRSLCTTLDSLKSSKIIPSFGLIEFNYRVYLRNLQDGSTSSIPNELYHNIEAMKQRTLESTNNEFLANLESNIEQCKSFINSLVADGGTALGPAMVSSLALAEEWNAERVILLTDGQANIGIGALEGPMSGGAAIYRHLAESFKKQGTSVDVVGVVSGQHLQLRTLGILSRMTRGNMYYVNPSEIDTALDDLAAMESIASDLRMRVVSSRRIRVNDVSGIDIVDAENLIETGQTNLSNVSIQDELYISLEGDTTEESEISVQVQLSYLDSDGKRRNRIFSTSIPITSDEQEFIDSIDPTIPATYAVQKSAMGQVDGESGQIQNDTEVLLGMAETLGRVGENSKNASLFNESSRKLRQMTSIIYEKVRRWRESNMQFFMAPVYSYAQADYEFVDAMKRARMSRDELFSRKECNQISW